MGDVLGHLKPQLVWKHFEELSKYPRPSKQEEKAVAYLLDLGKKLGIETLRDSFGNIIFRKPASKGRENVKTVVLQGHVDMVCEKNRGVEHDFENDPIKLYIDGDWVKADGTTLGADNGIGVAAALAVMEDNSLEHGPIECLITLDEETGLTGASNLQPGLLKAKILLNLDSEEEGSLYIGCSGGKDTKAHFAFTPEKVPAGFTGLEIKVTGLQGGHSGLEIHDGRGNAIKIVNRLLWELAKQYDMKLARIDGGNKHNAIPREVFVTVAVPQADAAKIKDVIAAYNATVREENSVKDSGVVVSCGEHDVPEFVMDSATQQKLICALYAVPHGVIKMSQDIPNLVESSTNLATIATSAESVDIVTSQRSSVASEIIDVVNMVVSVFKLAGAKTSHGDGYPGWKPNVHSEILGVFKSTYQELYGKEPEVKAIHAGLECGIIGEHYPELDMISCGPTMFGVHSPDEKLQISSVEPFYTLLTEVLKRIPTE